eukprot:TRINITY_DN10801_c1_g3_i1.p1 TRINITY_DN10801_c1_g3~~TRINITY_DN10801_c1_g3_i1.p1  ORF type:complete len:412 (+),score=163.79 TRINITY_DN10801_c1_g3_i1:148-1383(+)
MEFVAELYDNVKPTLSEWLEDAKKNDIKELGLYIAVDTGATNTRVALGTNEKQLITSKFKCDSTRDLIKYLNEVEFQLDQILNLKELNNDLVVVVKGACLAVAGRILENSTFCEITNYRLGENNKHRNLNVSELPLLLFPGSKTKFVNDLESACYGISGLNDSKLLHKYFKKFIHPKIEDNNNNNDDNEEDDSSSLVMKNENYLVLAVGTGLGVGLLISLNNVTNDDSFHVIHLEGGHLLMNHLPPSHEFYEEERRLFKFLSKNLYDDEHPPEFEDVVSGRGLEAIYQFILDDNNLIDDNNEQHDAPQIVCLACSNPPNVIAKKALKLHYLYLARATQQLAVVLQAKGIFWAGDNQVNNGRFVDSIIQDLQTEFLSHPKNDWLRIPIYCQTQIFNMNISGALYVARKIGSD